MKDNHVPELLLTIVLVMGAYIYAVSRGYPWALKMKARVDKKLDDWTEQAKAKTREVAGRRKK